MIMIKLVRLPNLPSQLRVFMIMIILRDGFCALVYSHTIDPYLAVAYSQKIDLIQGLSLENTFTKTLGLLSAVPVCMHMA
jgi:hypothetical protein